MSDEVRAAFAGAILAGLASLAVQLLGIHLSRRAARQAERSTRLAEFLAATHTAMLAIGRLAVLPLGTDAGQKAAFQQSDQWIEREDRVNNALNAIQLLDDESVAQAAVELDWCLITLERNAESAQWDRSDWRAHRSAIIDPSVQKIFASGRRSLGQKALDRGWSQELARSTVEQRGRDKSP